MAGFSYANGGGWTSCGWAKAPPHDDGVLHWDQKAVEVRVWKYTGSIEELDIDSPLMVATNDDMVLHILASVLERAKADVG